MSTRLAIFHREKKNFHEIETNINQQPTKGKREKEDLSSKRKENKKKKKHQDDNDRNESENTLASVWNTGYAFAVGFDPSSSLRCIYTAASKGVQRNGVIAFDFGARAEEHRVFGWPDTPMHTLLFLKSTQTMTTTTTQPFRPPVINVINPSPPPAPLPRREFALSIRRDHPFRPPTRPLPPHVDAHFYIPCPPSVIPPLPRLV